MSYSAFEFTDEFFNPAKNEVTEKLMLETAAAKFSEQNSRHEGSLGVVAWVRTGDASAESLLEAVDMLAGFDETDELMEEADEELYADVAESVCAAMEAFGVDFETSEAALRGSDDAARSAYKTITEALEETAETIEEMVNAYTMGEQITEAGIGSKSDFRMERKKWMLRKRRPKKRLSASQKMALRKNLRKAKRGAAMKLAQKTKKKRRSANFY